MPYLPGEHDRANLKNSPVSTQVEELTRELMETWLQSDCVILYAKAT